MDISFVNQGDQGISGTAEVKLLKFRKGDFFSNVLQIINDVFIKVLGKDR